jgi:hypothetical protein
MGRAARPLHGGRTPVAEEPAAGFTLGKKAVRAIFEIQDEEIMSAADMFFATLAVFTPVSTQIEVWQHEISKVSGWIVLHANIEDTNGRL